MQTQELFWTGEKLFWSGEKTKPFSYWFGSLHWQRPLNHALIGLDQMWFHIKQPIKIEVSPKNFSSDFDVWVYMRAKWQCIVTLSSLFMQ